MLSSCKPAWFSWLWWSEASINHHKTGPRCSFPRLCYHPGPYHGSASELWQRWSCTLCWSCRRSSSSNQVHSRAWSTMRPSELIFCDGSHHPFCSVRPSWTQAHFCSLPGSTSILSSLTDSQFLSLLGLFTFNCRCVLFSSKWDTDLLDAAHDCLAMNAASSVPAPM